MEINRRAGIIIVAIFVPGLVLFYVIKSQASQQDISTVSYVNKITGESITDYPNKGIEIIGVPPPTIEGTKSLRKILNDYQTSQITQAITTFVRAQSSITDTVYIESGSVSLSSSFLNVSFYTANPEYSYRMSGTLINGAPTNLAIERVFDEN